MTTEEYKKISRAYRRDVEHHIQVRCVNWFRSKYDDILIFAIPNGGDRNLLTAKKLKAEGVLKGVADLFVLYPNGEYAGLFIEMKTKDGRQQESQKEFQKYCEKVGYRYVVCRNEEEFEKEVEGYIENEIG